jgi:hypothetical protein
MDENATPLRMELSGLATGGPSPTVGSLLLYPDKLVHISLSPLGGLIGVVVARVIGNSRAARKVAAGHKSVTIPLSSISAIHVYEGTRVGAVIGIMAINPPLVTVQTTSGADYHFGLRKAGAWSDDLRRALIAFGRHVIPTEDGFSIV